MANTYSQLYVHLVFAVKGRQSLIHSEWKEVLYKYIAGIIRNQKEKLMMINGMADHVHLLIGIKPDKSISDLVRDIKSHSSKFINEQGFVQGRFEWQEGFGAFSVSQSQVPKLIGYIQNQETHHKKRSFHAEYMRFLKAYEIDFKPEYLFEPIT
jgi:REP element-mobilizing transposase RayT